MVWLSSAVSVKDINSPFTSTLTHTHIKFNNTLYWLCASLGHATEIAGKVRLYSLREKNDILICVSFEYKPPQASAWPCKSKFHVHYDFLVRCISPHFSPSLSTNILGYNSINWEVAEVQLLSFEETVAFFVNLVWLMWASCASAWESKCPTSRTMIFKVFI